MFEFDLAIFQCESFLIDKKKRDEEKKNVKHTTMRIRMYMMIMDDEKEP